MRDNRIRSARAALAVAVLLPLSIAVGLGGARPAAAQVALPTPELPDGTAPFVTDVRSAPAYTLQPSDLECIDALICIVAGNPPMRTADGGRTWQRMRVVQPTPDLFFERIDCATATRCVAAGSDGGVLTSTDAGASWRRTVTRPGIRDVTCTTATTCVAVGGPLGTAGAVTLLTADGGDTWIEVPQPGQTLMRVDCASTTFCVGFGATVATSTNGGRDWVDRPTVDVGLFLSLDCSDASTCLVLGTTGLAAVHPATHEQLTPPPILNGRPTSLSCGWSDLCLVTGDRQFTRDNVVVLIDPASGPRGEVVLSAPTGEVVAMDCTAPRCTAIGGASGPVGNATQIAVTTTSTDRGATWSAVVATARPEQYLDLTCTAAPAETCLIVGGNGTQGDPASLLDDVNEQGLVLRTTDSGTTWTPMVVPAETRLLLHVDCAGSLCLAAGFGSGPNRSVLLQSTDAGATWAVAPAPSGVSPSVVRCSDRDCFAVVPAGITHAIYGTTNGADWTFRSLGSVSFDCVAATCFDNDPAGALLVSTDGAATWTPTAAPPDSSPVLLRGCALTRCYATGNTGSSPWLESTDGGRTWVTTPTNATISHVTCVGGRCFAVASAGIALPADGGAVLATAPVAALNWTPDAVSAFTCTTPTRCLVLERTPGTASRATVRRIELLTPPLRAVTPERLLDTRPAGSTTDQRHQGTGVVPANTTYRLDVRGRGSIAADATSVNLNVTVTEPTGDGFVTVYPCDRDRPTASNVNVRAGATVANAATVPLASDGTVCIYTWSATHLVVDAAAYVPGGVSSWTALTPARLLDTRDGAVAVTVDGTQRGGGPQAAATAYILPVRGRGGVSADAAAVTVTVTAVAPDGPGFVTVHPCDSQRPTASNLNYAADDVVANAVTVPIASDGTICLYSLARTHLVVDVNAFAGPAVTRVTAVEPARLLDSRRDAGASTVDGTFLGFGPLGQAGQHLDVRGRGGVPADARTAVLTIAATQARAPTFVTVWPCALARPVSSIVNVVPGQTAANTVIVDITRPVCVASLSQVDVVVDVNAYSR